VGYTHLKKKLSIYKNIAPPVLEEVPQAKNDDDFFQKDNCGS
jgi:hypothetical protein